MKAKTLLAVAMGLLAFASTAARGDTGDKPWSPTRLQPDIRDTVARAYKREFDIRRAELGYLYVLPAFLHLKQRYEFLHNFTAYMGDRGNPFGQFLLMREPASPRTRDPMPNYDTLYGATFLDLRTSPMVLSIPDIPGRYYSFALLDAYFYNFDYVGSRTTGQKAGNYLIVGPGWKGVAPKGITKIIQAPTNSMHIYERVYFKDRADIAAVNKIQDQVRIVPLARFLDAKAQVSLPDPLAVLKANPLAVQDPVQMFEMANAYMAENPPPATDRILLEHFATVGIGPGVQVPTSAEDREILRQGAELAGKTITALAFEGLRTKNGWQVSPVTVGQRGPGGTALQAMTQVRAIGINVPDEAVYYNAYTDGADRPLNSSKRYAIHFDKDQIPPVLKEKFGFWSVTLYGRENHGLVDNPAGKYAVRSGDPFVLAPDGSLTLYVQSEAPADPKLRANWLPMPTQGEFVLCTRVYVGGPAVVQGDYFPPPVTEMQ